jgi:hypothetical protein
LYKIYIYEIKSRVALAKAGFTMTTVLFTSKSGLSLRKKLLKSYILSAAFSGAETWTLRKVDQKYLESSEMWCRRRTEKISWTDRVRNEEVLYTVKDRNILSTIKRRKAKWIGHILRRNCLTKYVIDGNTEAATGWP